MLSPKKSKFKKYQAIPMRTIKHRSSESFGEHAIVTTEAGRVTARQLESVRRVIARGMGRQGKVWLKVFPHIPQTDKPREARGGKGKGDVSYWGTDIPAGSIVLEVSGISGELAKVLLLKASHKLSVTTMYRKRNIPKV